METVLVSLMQAISSGIWYEIDFAMNRAKEFLGYDPTSLEYIMEEDI